MKCYLILDPNTPQHLEQPWTTRWFGWLPWVDSKKRRVCYAYHTDAGYAYAYVAPDNLDWAKNILTTNGYHVVMAAPTLREVKVT